MLKVAQAITKCKGLHREQEKSVTKSKALQRKLKGNTGKIATALPAAWTLVETAALSHSNGLEQMPSVLGQLDGSAGMH